jgi:hypothetical protein
MDWKKNLLSKKIKGDPKFDIEIKYKVKNWTKKIRWQNILKLNILKLEICCLDNLWKEITNKRRIITHKSKKTMINKWMIKMKVSLWK